MDTTEKRIALLIDADNAPASKIDVILAEIARHGVANVRRAYGNWKSQHLAGWEKALHAYAIRPIQQFAYSTGKNASDMAMVIDAMDLLYARNLDGFAIVSSDADFTPMVMRLRSDGVSVYGFGEAKTPEPFVKACSVFLYLESWASPKRRARQPRPKRRPPRWCCRTIPRWYARFATRSMRRRAMTAGRTWAPSAAISATRVRSTRATTVIANLAT